MTVIHSRRLQGCSYFGGHVDEDGVVDEYDGFFWHVLSNLVRRAYRPIAFSCFLLRAELQADEGSQPRSQCHGQMRNFQPVHREQ